MDLSLLTIALSGAAVTAVGTLVYSLRSLPNTLVDKFKQKFIYTVKVYQYDDLFEILENWLSINCEKNYKDVEASIGSSDNLIVFSEDREKRPVLKYKQEDNTFIINYENKKIIINKSREKMEKAQSMKDFYFRKYTLSGFRAKSTIDKLLNEAIDLHHSQKNPNTVRVSTNSNYEWYCGKDVKVKPIDKAIICNDHKKYILDDIADFLNNEEWYIDSCIPYKRGYCFYGPPGTGKTTLALALALHTKRSVYCLNLNCVEDDSRLPYLFNTIPANSILLIEDIDKVFCGRENVTDSKISFSSLLNCLDGACYKHGLITIISTNHIEKLDEALLRTGRMDVKIEIPTPSECEISEYLSVFYRKNINITGKFNLKMSDIQEICLSFKNDPDSAIEEISKKNLENPE